MSTSQVVPRTIDHCRCPECGQTCLQKNIYRHMTTLHEWNREDCKLLLTAIRTEKKGKEAKSPFLCAYCRAVFRTIRHLVQHNRICTAQPGMLENDEMMNAYMDELIVEQEEVVGIQEFVEEVEEPEDDKPSTSSAAYQEVEVPPHRLPLPPAKIIPRQPSQIKIEQDLEKGKYCGMGGGRHRGVQTRCPECPETVESIEDLLSHCHEKHETDGRKFFLDNETFSTHREFKKWFDQRQEDTCTSLTKRTGHAGETLYRCHRIGKYQSVAKARKSNPRKIDQTCTAFLRVFTRDGDGITWATGCFTHIGHELDHKLLWLTETQENYVRELIDLGWTHDQIFFYIREEYKHYECKLKYISKNDIRNINVRYNREKDKQQELLNSQEQEQEKPSEEEETVVVDSEEFLVTNPEPEVGKNTEEIDETPAKIPRVSPSPPLEPAPVLTKEKTPVNDEKLGDVEMDREAEKEVEDVKTQEILNPDPKKDEPTSSKPPEEAVEEENEYINVVDDEPLPKLDRIAP